MLTRLRENGGNQCRSSHGCRRSNRPLRSLNDLCATTPIKLTYSAWKPSSRMAASTSTSTPSRYDRSIPFYATSWSWHRKPTTTPACVTPSCSRNPTLRFSERGLRNTDGSARVAVTVSGTSTAFGFRAALARKPELAEHITILTRDAFFPTHWGRPQDIFVSQDIARFSKTYCLHLFETVSLRHLRRLTADTVRQGDSAYCQLARRFA